MSNVLILSENEEFKTDLEDQIRHHAPELTVVDDSQADIIVIDENMKLLENNAAKDNKAPVILLSGFGETLEGIGVSQVIEKPFFLSSFLYSIKASIHIFENSADGALEFNQYILYPIRKEIMNLRNNELIKLTEKEVSIIKYLYKNKDKIISKSDLMKEVWGYALDAATHTVETHIYRLRQKVEHEDEAAQLILTSEGGYQLKF